MQWFANGPAVRPCGIRWRMKSTFASSG